MKQKNNLRKIIIDTDPGHDDALALMLAERSGKFDIKMISTVAGNSTINNTTKNARYIIDLLERNDIPVYSGESKPIKRELVRAFVHGESGLAGIDPDIAAGLTGNAADKIISFVEENPNEITLISLGPLTNVARAIQKNPSAMRKLKEIFIMGGAINVPGNQKGISEFNIYVDPEAADIVMNFDIKKTLVPLDACNDIIMQLEDFEPLKGNRLYEPMISMLKPYIKNTSIDQGVDGALMYDPLTVYALLKPEKCIFKNYLIKVDTGSDETRGKFYSKSSFESNSSSVRVAMSISQDFKDDFINILAGKMSK